jgi:hypothetical protein
MERTASDSPCPIHAISFHFLHKNAPPNAGTKHLILISLLWHIGRTLVRLNGGMMLALQLAIHLR